MTIPPKMAHCKENACMLWTPVWATIHNKEHGILPFTLDVLDGLLQVTRMTHHIGGAELGHTVDNQETA